MARRVRTIEDPELARTLRAAIDQGLLSVDDTVHALRAIGGISQRNLARRTGVPERVIKTIESGKSHPNIATLEKLAASFDLRIAFVSVRSEVKLFNAKAWCAEGRRRRTGDKSGKAAEAMKAPDPDGEGAAPLRALSYVPRKLA
ncbi:MAG: helix-turn-helix domain-containing protein [Steroidobacteraceae bacterium]